MSDYFTLLGKLEHAQSEPDDLALWREALGSAMLFLGVTAQEIADHTEACRSSPRRWLKGVSAPRRCVREDVLAFLVWKLTTGQYDKSHG